MCVCFTSGCIHAAAAAAAATTAAGEPVPVPSGQCWYVEGRASSNRCVDVCKCLALCVRSSETEHVSQACNCRNMYVSFWRFILLYHMILY